MKVVSVTQRKPSTTAFGQKASSLKPAIRRAPIAKKKQIVTIQPLPQQTGVFKNFLKRGDGHKKRATSVNK